MARARPCLYISALYFDSQALSLTWLSISMFLKASLVPPLLPTCYISHSESSLAILETSTSSSTCHQFTLSTSRTIRAHWSLNKQPVQSITNVSELPKHLLAIYVIVSWLHIQFNLPWVACNALLKILVCLVTFVSTQLAQPFVMLPSVTCSLAIDPSIDLLPVCPKCQDVFLSAALQHVQDACMSCKVPLFLPSHTNWGNPHNIKTPVIKYPYLLLLQQLVSMLKIPSIKALLDNWRTKPCKSREYKDIFNGDMCHIYLKAPNSSTFFSNLYHERQGPGRELWIGVNLGVS